MKFSATAIAFLSLAASTMGSPTSRNQQRWITTKLTLCQEPNLQDCDDTFVPIDTCFKVPECTVQSLNAQGHVCDYYSDVGCSGTKYKHFGIQQNLPQGTTIRSVFCW
ncbi:hypothetical protein VFPPC_10346 [Pochonia chlamydosporia 170]|uniref:Uncharacterized protein n=1 Tax=Pochonia chlamydosporia 170 TaxID=1380566 RepID=A0A179EZL2_METCM|nr:hypothetical protein VFPPC_10346 [Pochonia chlamydosporia 170]OAQ58634.1 hypothetical protein VFPPC_10346 [Pochonia chlamydosporia 170]